MFNISDDLNILEVNWDDLPEKPITNGSVEALVSMYIHNLPIRLHEIIKVVVKCKSNKKLSNLLSCYISRPDVNRYRLISFTKSQAIDIVIGEDIGDVTTYEVDQYELMTSSLVTNLTLMLVLFFERVEINKTYPFYESKLIKKKSGVTIEQSTRRIVYLGRPPSHNRNVVGDKTIGFGYAKRPYRRTLTHERFKNHPKFKVYNGVAVKGSWCGPNKYRNINKVYRLWTPPKMDTV